MTGSNTVSRTSRAVAAPPKVSVHSFIHSFIRQMISHSVSEPAAAAAAATGGAAAVGRSYLLDARMQKRRVIVDELPRIREVTHDIEIAHHFLSDVNRSNHLRQKPARIRQKIVSLHAMTSQWRRIAPHRTASHHGAAHHSRAAQQNSSAISRQHMSGTAPALHASYLAVTFRSDGTIPHLPAPE